MRHKKLFLLFAFILCAFSPVIFAQEKPRQRPLDLRIVIDNSLSLKNGKAGAVNWLCGSVVDDMLETGDYFLLAVSKEQDEILFDGIIGDETQKNEIKDKIRAIPESGGLSYAEKTLKTIIEKNSKMPAGALPVRLLVCGPDVKTESGLLKYSRAEHFAYWRVITIGVNIESALDAALKKAL